MFLIADCGAQLYGSVTIAPPSRLKNSLNVHAKGFGQLEVLHLRLTASHVPGAFATETHVSPTRFETARFSPPPPS